MSWGFGSWGSGAWGSTLSALAEISAVGSGAATQQLLYGRDIMFDGDFRVGANKDWVLVEGLAALTQAIYHRLITRPGEYKFRPEYGVGILSFIKKRNRVTELRELEQRIIDQLSLDPRIEEVVSINVESLPAGAPGIKVGIKIRALGRTLRYRPLTMTDETVGGGIG